MTMPLPAFQMNIQWQAGAVLVRLAVLLVAINAPCYAANDTVANLNLSLSLTLTSRANK